MRTIKHILITAGGTVEPIDGVRKISNTSTGSLCACIYEALADFVTAAAHTPKGEGHHFQVHYVVSETAVRPKTHENLPILFYPVSDVASVEAVLEELLAQYDIDYVIHGMAVSDFTKDYLIEREELICELADRLEVADGNQLTGDALKALLRDVLTNPERQLDVSTKVRSKADLMLALKRTPKLMETIKRLSPNAYLVAFKLLKGVSDEHLIRVASQMLEQNDCDLVLANDLKKIQKDSHEGLLLRGREVIGRYQTKREIAEGIAGHLLGGGTEVR